RLGGHPSDRLRLCQRFLDLRELRSQTFGRRHAVPAVARARTSRAGAPREFAGAPAPTTHLLDRRVELPRALGVGAIEVPPFVRPHAEPRSQHDLAQEEAVRELLA